MMSDCWTMLRRFEEGEARPWAAVGAPPAVSRPVCKSKGLRSMAIAGGRTYFSPRGLNEEEAPWRDGATLQAQIGGAAPRGGEAERRHSGAAIALINCYVSSNLCLK